MPDYSLIQVLQMKRKQIMIDMANIQIKSEKPTHFVEFLVMQHYLLHALRHYYSTSSAQGHVICPPLLIRSEDFLICLKKMLSDSMIVSEIFDFMSDQLFRSVLIFIDIIPNHNFNQSAVCQLVNSGCPYIVVVEPILCITRY